jgi:hypothetical protein
MSNSTSSKHSVQVENPLGRTLSVAYSTLKEAQDQAVALERAGYKILGISPSSLPKPNAV